MSTRRSIGLGLAIAASLGVWIWFREPRAHRPATPAALSSIVELDAWTINDRSIDTSTTLQLTVASDVQCAGQLHTDPKAWSNVAKTLKRSRLKGYTKPFLNLVCQFVSADGDESKVAIHRQLSFVKSDRGDCSFDGKVRVPSIPGEYELQLVVGVASPESPKHDNLPLDWHVVARCSADVASAE